MMKKLFISIFLLYTYLSHASGIGLVKPINNFVSPVFTVEFTWNKTLNFTSYRLLISRDELFHSILKDTIINQNSTSVSFDKSITQLYWKVQVANSNAFISSTAYKLSFINPSQNNNLLLWMAADSNLTVLADSSIDTWSNIVPNNLNAVQLNADYKPKLKSNVTNIANGKTVRFDGVNDYLQINNGGHVGNSYILMNWNGSSPFPGYNAAFVRQDGSQNYFLFFSFFQGTTSIRTNGYYSNFNYINGLLSQSFAPINDFKVISGRRTPRDTVSDFAPNFTIGRDPDGGLGRCWNGDIAEIIVSKRDSSVTESDSIHTYLYNKYAPPIAIEDIIIGNSFCSPVTITTPVYYKNHQWSTGATTPSVSVTPNSAYSVSVKNIFGLESTTSFNVYPYRRLNNATVYICPGQTYNIQLNTPPGFSVLWNTGASTTNLAINQTGTYTVKITDNAGCFVYDTINVIVDNPHLSSIPENNLVTACSGEKLFILSGSPLDSVFWSTGSNENYIQLSTSQSNLSVYAITQAGCILHDTFNVTIAGQAPTADFTSSSLCQNAITSFTDLSAPPSGDVISSWKWNFSNNTTATQQNPSTVFTSLGTVSAALKITTNRGCTDSLYKTFTVYKRPKAGFYNLLACSGNPTTFVDTSRAGSGTLSTYFWNFAGLGSSNNTTPVFSFPDVATYNVFHQVTNSYGCTDTITRSVFINPSPVSNFSFDSVCVGGTSYTSFKYLPTIQSPFTIDIFNWDFGDGVQNNSVKNPTHTFPGAGVYNVQLYVQASNQCVDTIQKEVQVFEPVNVDFVTSATQCVGKDIQFTDISTSQGLPISNWNWFFAGEGSSSVQNPTHAFNQQGNYVVQLTASNSIGCSGTKQRSIAVSDVPAPNFTFTPSYGLPPLVVNYTNLSPANGSYIWSYGDGTLPVTGYNPPAHSYSGVGTYPIKLISTNYRGCTDSIIKYILVDQAYIDGVMVEVRLIPNGEFYKIQVTITNNSNIEITQMGLSIQLGNGSVIRENWTGSILPSQTINYTFSGEVKLANENAIPVICASIDNINNQSAENRTDNNTTCKEISIGNFDVISIYPNPANESATFGIMLPRDGKVTILLIDALGQIEYKTAFNGVKGYNNLNVSLLPLNAGVYVAEIIYDNNIVYRKLEKSDKK